VTSLQEIQRAESSIEGIAADQDANSSQTTNGRTQTMRKSHAIKDGWPVVGLAVHVDQPSKYRSQLLGPSNRESMISPAASAEFSNAKVLNDVARRTTARFEYHYGLKPIRCVKHFIELLEIQ
jgi:hypothetical protein